MTRAVSAVLVISGTLLLATWLAQPATSAPQAATRHAVPSDAALPPELDDMNAEVARLRARLEPRVELSDPVRDPFRFAPRSRPSREVREVVVAEPPTVESTIVWPTLVAILTASDGTRQAAVAHDDQLDVVSVGTKVGSFIVAEISTESVTFTDERASRSHQQSIR